MPQAAGDVRRAKPAFNADAVKALLRQFSFGELVVANMLADEMAQAEEGSLFSAVNPTPGTGIAQTIQTTFSATNGILTLRNNAANANKRIYPKLLRLINTVAGASATRSEALVSVDNITRYSSGGSSIATLANRNMDDATASEAVVHFGALTLAAESGSVRRVSRFQLRTAIMVAFEEWVIRFGTGEGDGAVLAGTAPSVIKNLPAVVLGQGDSMQVHLWNPGNAVTAPSWEFELCWLER